MSHLGWGQEALPGQPSLKVPSTRAFCLKEGWQDLPLTIVLDSCHAAFSSLSHPPRLFFTPSPESLLPLSLSHLNSRQLVENSAFHR